jgi:lipopolysaccharide transport system permease protein
MARNETHPGYETQTLERSLRNSASVPPAPKSLFARIHLLTDLLVTLVEREMKVLYKRSILGVAWTMILPLLQLLICSFMFRAVMKVQVCSYASFAFSGLLAWTWFQASLIDASGCIIKQYALIKQPSFPTSMLPVASVSTWLIHYILGLPVLLVFLGFDGIRVTPAIFFLPVVLFIQFLFTLALSYPLAALNVTFRDTQHTLTVCMNLAAYVTPVFYSLSSVPERYRALYALNPMTHLLQAYRDVLLFGTHPQWLSLVALAIVASVLLAFGHWFFKKQSLRFVEEL